MARRISDLEEVHQIKDQLVEKCATHQKRIKEAFDRKAKIDSFKLGTLFLNGIHSRRRKATMGSSMLCGLGLLSFLSRGTTLSCFKVWKKKQFLMTQLIGDF